jgi:hypothetical protein
LAQKLGDTPFIRKHVFIVICKDFERLKIASNDLLPLSGPAFARLTPELQLARQPKNQQVREPRFAFSGEGCPP